MTEGRHIYVNELLNTPVAGSMLYAASHMILSSRGGTVRL